VLQAMTVKHFEQVRKTGWFAAREFKTKATYGAQVIRVEPNTVAVWDAYFRLFRSKIISEDSSFWLLADGSLANVSRELTEFCKSQFNKHITATTLRQMAATSIRDAFTKEEAVAFDRGDAHSSQVVKSHYDLKAAERDSLEATAIYHKLLSGDFVSVPSLQPLSPTAADDSVPPADDSALADDAMTDEEDEVPPTDREDSEETEDEDDDVDFVQPDEEDEMSTSKASVTGAKRQRQRSESAEEQESDWEDEMRKSKRPNNIALTAPQARLKGARTRYSQKEYDAIWSWYLKHRKTKGEHLLPNQSFFNLMYLEIGPRTAGSVFHPTRTPEMFRDTWKTILKKKQQQKSHGYAK
jgi:hypothetical protein